MGSDEQQSSSPGGGKMELKIKDFEALSLTPEDVATLAHATFRMTIAVVLALSRETAETLI